MGDVVKVLDTPPPITFTERDVPRGLHAQQVRAAACGQGAASFRRQVPHGGQLGPAASKYSPDGVNNLEGLLLPRHLPSGVERRRGEGHRPPDLPDGEGGHCRGRRLRAVQVQPLLLSGAHDRFDHREGGEDGRRPPEDREGDLQPPREGDEPRDRRNGHLRDGRQRRSADVRRHQQHELGPTTRTRTPVCRRVRSRCRGRPRSTRR